MLYAEDRRLLSSYLREEDGSSTFGVYVRMESGRNTYLHADNPMQPLSRVLFDDYVMQENSLPSKIDPEAPSSDIPDELRLEPFSDSSGMGIRFLVPIMYKQKKQGMLVGDMFYTDAMVERYAALSKTAVNIFAGSHLNVGTLDAQQTIELEALEQIASCHDLASQTSSVHVIPVTFGNEDYSQGGCAFRNSQNETVGAMTVSLSQQAGRQEIQKLFISVLAISGVVVCLAFLLLLVFSRSTIQAIKNIVSVIGDAAEGDLRGTALSQTHDEIGLLAKKLNRMIEQLRQISGRVQEAASTVNHTADTILRKTEGLMRHMEAQSASVDAATGSVEHITQFIQTVSQDMIAFLDTSELVLSSIQQTQSSIAEVTTNTGTLALNLQLIVSSIDQVSQSVKQISDSVGQLDEIAGQGEVKVQHIHHSFQNVSHNALDAQQLAQETMDAALNGQASVEDSIQGMNDLKLVMADTARIIQEVNSWGEQVSSILDMVDEITEQTSLLALNASIISAQAGSHGKGFAVVADEIKNLAVRTKSSTKEIASLVHQLQAKTEEGVSKMKNGLQKAAHGVKLANAVGKALESILDSATRSSNRANDTAQVIQQTAESNRIISSLMIRVTEMVSHIRQAIHKQEQDMEKVAEAVENISGMAEQVNQASVEQRKTADQIMESMESADQKFRFLSDQTIVLQENSEQIMEAMHRIEETTIQTLMSGSSLSGDAVTGLVKQSESLQKLVSIFKIS